MQISGKLSYVVGMILVLALAGPAAAQGASSPAAESTTPVFGATYAFLQFNSFARSSGFDVNYATKTFTQPATSLGIRVGVVVEGGVHPFNGDSLKLIQGGAYLKSDRLERPRFQPYGHVMFGIGHFDEGNDKILSLMAGADMPLQGHSVKLRAEIGQVWDFFSGGEGGGHEVAWRYSFGIALPLK